MIALSIFQDFFGLLDALNFLHFKVVNTILEIKSLIEARSNFFKYSSFSNSFWTKDVD